ncbi:MAG: tetratricopeptide repeat protein, partial [Planctomycetaceae bacterium]|nr:tetratricopeptide repeat protein [Planctomycetaceae bacterium]
YLNNEQVQACPPTVWYRLQKFSRKNRGLLTMTGICLLMLFAASGVSIAYAVQAQTARKDADEQRQEAIAAKEESDRRLKQSRIDFERALKSLDTIVGEASSVEFAQLPGVEKVRTDILQRAMAFYEEIIADHDNDLYARAHRAMAMHNIAKIYEAHGNARMFLEELNKAIAEMESVLQESPEDNKHRSYMVAMLGSRMHIGVQGLTDRVKDARRCLELSQQMKASGEEVSASTLAFFSLKIAEMMTPENPEADGYVDEAIRISQEAGVAPPPGAYIWLAARSAESNELDDAVRHYHEGISLYERWATDPGNRYPHVERCIVSTERGRLALVLERQKKISDAESLFRRAFEDAVQLAAEYPQMAWYQQMLQYRAIEFLEYLNRHSRITEASDLIAALENQFPTSQRPHIARAALAELSGQPDEACRHFEAAEAAGPTDASLPRRYAEFLIRINDSAGAMRELEKTLAMEPGQWSMQKRVAALHFEAGRYSDALEDIRKAVEVNPNDLSAITWIGIEKIVGCPDDRFRTEYLKLIDDAVVLNENTVEVILLRALFRVFMDESRQAQADLKALSENSNLTAYQSYVCALLSLKLHDSQYYSDICRTIIGREIASNSATDDHFKAWTCALAPKAINDYKRAIEFSRRAVAAEPMNVLFRVGLGAILFRAGDLDEAHKVLTEALELPARDGTSPAYIHYFLAMAEHRRGHSDEAKGHLQKANEIADAELSKSPSWNRRLTLELLRSEAAAFVRVDSENE